MIVFILKVNIVFFPPLLNTLRKEALEVTGRTNQFKRYIYKLLKALLIIFQKVCCSFKKKFGDKAFGSCISLESRKFFLRDLSIFRGGFSQFLKRVPLNTQK